MEVVAKGLGVTADKAVGQPERLGIGKGVIERLGRSLLGGKRRIDLDAAADGGKVVRQRLEPADEVDKASPAGVQQG